MNVCPTCEALYWNGPFPHKCAPVWIAVTRNSSPADYVNVDVDLDLAETVTVRAHDAEDAAAKAAQRFDDSNSEGPSENRLVGVVDQAELEQLKFQRRVMQDSLVPCFTFEWFNVTGELTVTYMAHSVST